MVISTRNTSSGNNSNEVEESMRDMVLRLQEIVTQMNQRIEKDLVGINNVNDEEKVRLALIHLYEKALTWHRQFEKINGDLVTWEVYEVEIYKRFGPCYEDPMEEIKNLRQNGTVLDYQDQFEALVSRVELTESQVISCFVAGLQQEIGLMLKMFRPKSLYDAYQLARIQETVKAINTKRYTLILSTPNHPVNTAYINRSITYHAKSPTTQLALPSTPYTKPFTV
ncbi:gypsy/ty3 retroelement polyprotein [Tanacetum coccineum]